MCLDKSNRDIMFATHILLSCVPLMGMCRALSFIASPGDCMAIKLRYHGNPLMTKCSMLRVLNSLRSSDTYMRQ